MDTESFQTSYFHKSEGRQEDSWRHHCGCIRTSDKLKQILKSFPSTPPPSPSHYEFPNTSLNNTCISAYCTGVHKPLPLIVVSEQAQKNIPAVSSSEDVPKDVRNNDSSKTWRMVGELVQLLQLSVTATALALYYLIYCYMQLVYYTLRSALYFHNADGGVVWIRIAWGGMVHKSLIEHKKHGSLTKYGINTDMKPEDMYDYMTMIK